MINYQGDKTYKIFCLSTDVKPTLNASSGGSYLFEIDTGKTYIYNSEGQSWAEYSESGGGGGDDKSAQTLKELLEGTITELDTGDITKLGDYALANSPSLVSVVAPKVTSIGYSCFFGCRSLTSITANNVSTIGIYAFTGATKLSSFNAPRLTELSSAAFSGCTKLKTFLISESLKASYSCVTDSVFYNCASLETAIDFPNAVTVESDAFYGCTNIPSVNMPKLKVTKYRSFGAMKKITELNFPDIITWDSYACAQCTALTKVDFGTSIKVIQTQSFSDTALKTLIIRNTTAVPTLSATSAFNNTPIATSTEEGFIYVPDALVESYKTATNWSTFASKIKPLSELSE